MIIYRQRVFASSPVKQLKKIRTLFGKAVQAEKEHGFNSPQAEKFRNLIKRENVLLDMKLDSGQQVPKEMLEKYGVSLDTLKKYAGEHESIGCDILQQAGENLERNLSPAGKKTLERKSNKAIKKSGMNTVDNKNLENYINVVDKTLEEEAKKRGFTGVDDSAKAVHHMLYTSSPHINVIENAAYLPKRSLAGELNAAVKAHEVIGHGSKNIEGSDIALSPIKNLDLMGETSSFKKSIGGEKKTYTDKDYTDDLLTMMDSPYYMSREEGANQKIRDFAKKRLSKNDRKALNDYYDAQELANKYTTTTGLFRHLKKS